jgi:arsenical pump membrane protein
MQVAHVSTVLVWAISLASILCMLLRPRRIAEAYWACGGGTLLILTRLIPLPQAAHAVFEGLDVYLFLTGMMILAELAREEGVFDSFAPTLYVSRHPLEASNSSSRNANGKCWSICCKA